MKSHHEVSFQEETLSIEEILLVVSDVSEQCWNVIEALRAEGNFYDTVFLNLLNRIDSFKDHAVDASANISIRQESEAWIQRNAGKLDRLIQSAARFLSSHGEEPFARNLEEWHVRLKEKDIKESEARERFNVVTVSTLSAVASIPGVLPDALRKEAAMLAEETERLNKWERALDKLVHNFEEGLYLARDVSDLLGYVAECARLYCHGNLSSLLRLMNFSSEDFVNLADACHADALDGSESDVVAALYTDFFHFMDRLRAQFLHRLRDIWKIPPPEETAAA